MTTTTVYLLEGRSRRYPTKWLPRFAEIHVSLRDEHGVPSLGNFRDPVREIFYIVLSAKTTEVLYQRAYRALWSKFGSISQIASATPRTIASCIDMAGLGNKRAEQISMISRRLVDDYGKNPSRSLRRLSVDDSYHYLKSLPGVGPKSALCIMMYSLDHDVFPVDVNVYRVARRIGALRSNLKHYEAQKLLPRKIPDGIAKELHIGLVVHGRRVCRPRTPLCGQCVIRQGCDYWHSRENGQESD